MTSSRTSIQLPVDTEILPDHLISTPEFDKPEDEIFKYKIPQPDLRFLWVFPEKLELALSFIDDSLIKMCQRAKGRFFFGLSFFLTCIVAIEIMVLLPVVLFILGYDLIATKFCIWQ